MKKAAKILSLTLIAFSAFFMLETSVLALNFESGLDGMLLLAPMNCDTLFGDPEVNTSVAYWVQWCLDLIKYIAIVALLVLSSVDFLKAIVSSDKDALKKAGKTTVKRLVFCVIIFFLPIIVEVIMKLFGAYGTCNIG